MRSMSYLYNQICKGMPQLYTFGGDLQTSCEAETWAGLDADSRPGWKGCWTRAMTPGCGVSATGSCVLKARHLGRKQEDICQSAQTEYLFCDRFMSFHQFHLVCFGLTETS